MTHTYSNLIHHDSMRLLTLLPTDNHSGGGPLICSLEDCRISHKPSYEALSYTWGEAILPEVLHTQSGTLKITKNLALALHALRLKDRARCLWVDSVCINQEDMLDKSRQVAMMGAIYKSATQVVCWLGEADESTRYALDTFRNITALTSECGITEVRPSHPRNFDSSNDCTFRP